MRDYFPTFTLLRALPLLALALSSGACREKETVQSSDAGLSCEDNFRLVNGECVFVCNRDGDCPEGNRCNLLTGTCVAQATGPDGGPPVVCTTGALRCTQDNKGVETCQENGTWVQTEACAAPYGFCQNETCLFCQPGKKFCDASNPTQSTVCLDDGSGTRTVQCAASATCTEGECRECEPDKGRCTSDGKTAQLCRKSSDETLEWTWTNNGDALDGTCVTQVCQAPTATTAQCLAPACFPGVAQCKSATVQQLCSATGVFEEIACSSIPGNGPFAECVNGVCIDECVEAEKAKSYFGCDYWSAVQDNAVDRFFKGGTSSGQGTNDSDFAFVVTNRSLSSATVTVKRWLGNAESTVKTVTVPGRNDAATRGLAVIKVPWQSIGSATDGVSASGKARYAYRLTSTRPISVYQFSPLDAVRTGASCTTNSTCTQAYAGVCQVPTSGGSNKICHYYTYSNDASLLLPSHILGKSYVALTNEHIKDTASGGTSAFNAHITLVGTEDGTTVTVKSSAVTRAGTGVTALAKDQTQAFTLDRYEVLQIASDLPNPNTATECVDNPFVDPLTCGLFGSCSDLCRVNNDLTGTIVTSDKPIAAFGGSSCTVMPHGQAACDHLEEQLFPFVTWGKTFVATRTAPLRMTSGSFASSTNAAPDYYKIVAGCSPADCPNGTTIQLNPAPTSANIFGPNLCQAGTSLTANNCRLLGGDFVFFASKTSFTVTADQPISVGQFFAGQNATSGGLLDSPAQGDPSFVLLPPAEQWRSNYTLLTAPGIKDNYLAIAIDETKVASVEVDGVAVPLNTFTKVTGTNYLVKNQPVTVGTHTLLVKPKPGLSAVPGAGVTVYGFDSYVSYGYTGGLDLSTIVTGVNPGG